MKKKGQESLIKIVIIGLVLVVVILSFFIFSSEEATEEAPAEVSVEVSVEEAPAKDSSSEESITILKEVFNNLIQCFESGDIDCACEYISEIDCEALREPGVFKSNANIVKAGLRPIKIVGEWSSFQDPNLNSGLPTSAAKVSFTGTIRGEETCLQWMFVKEEGKWKIFGEPKWLYEAWCIEGAFSPTQMD